MTEEAFLDIYFQQLLTVTSKSD